MMLPSGLIQLNLGGFIVYIEGSLAMINIKRVSLSMRIVFVVADSIDPDERFNLGLHCLLEYAFKGLN